MAVTQGKPSGGRASVALPTARMPTETTLRKFAPEERDRLNRILTEPIDHMHHPSFEEAKTARALFGDEMSAIRSTKPWCNSAETARVTDLSTVPTSTLTTPEEQRLFLRFNYARYRVGKLLKAFANKRLTARAAAELLWWHARAGVARCEIIQANMPLVLAMAKRTRLGNIDYAELISEGNMALLRSAAKFDCGRGFKFSTYACRAILKSFSRVAMRTSRYRGRFPLEFDPLLEKSDYLELRRIEIEADCVDDLMGILNTNTADLNEVEVRVIRERFALAGDPEEARPKTLEQVGTLIGVTKERVRQIQNRALNKLRVKLEEDYLAA